MTRPLRIQYEGATYHVLSRGNRGEAIFSIDQDKEFFLDVLNKGTCRYGIDLNAYCIMSNHYHLLISIPGGELTRFMHYVGSSYGSYLRRKRGWIGHVFAGRYKSLCVEKESYLLELSRYIHLNPVRARLVKMPEDYKWSSYMYYVDQGKRPEWLNINWLLEEFGETLNKSQNEYRGFVLSAIDNPPNFPEEKIVGQAILGNETFVKEIVKGVKQNKGLNEITGKRIYSENIDMDHLYRIVCEHYKLGELEEGEQKRKGIKCILQMFIYLAKRETAALNKEIAVRVGGLSPSGVTRRYIRIIKKLEGDENTIRKWKMETEKIMSIVKG